MVLIEIDLSRQQTIKRLLFFCDRPIQATSAGKSSNLRRHHGMNQW